MNDVVNMLQDLMDFDPRGSEIKSSETPSAVFQSISEKQALETFKTAAKTVPAYKDFLNSNKIDPEKIKTFDDFQKVPLTDKKNYLTKYPLQDLLIGGTFDGKAALTSSSGSSGASFYWPRFPIQDFGATKGWDSFLVNTFDIDRISTFHVNCSGMGVWTAGDYISLLNKYISYKYSSSFSCSPGIDMDNTIKLLENISPQFEQTILYSYPPFAKDIIDRIPPRILKKINIKIVVYGEAYSEKWRNYILDKINGSQKDFYNVSSVLGSSEGGLIGIESKACSLIRILANKKKTCCERLFGENRVPSLVQYNPMAKFIEIISNNIVMTSMGGLPLIRYDTHDYGNVLTKENIVSIYREACDEDLIKEAKRYKTVITSSPYLYVFGRSDYTASIYGVLIYPETIKDILTSKPFSKFFSGKFAMKTTEDNESNQILSIILETKSGLSAEDVSIPAIEKLFADHISLYSSEYNKLLSASGERVYPKISLRSYGDDEYFSSKNKHKYLI